MIQSTNRYFYNIDNKYSIECILYNKSYTPFNDNMFLNITSIDDIIEYGKNNHSKNTINNFSNDVPVTFSGIASFVKMNVDTFNSITTSDIDFGKYEFIKSGVKYMLDFPINVDDILYVIFIPKVISNSCFSLNSEYKRDVKIISNQINETLSKTDMVISFGTKVSGIVSAKSTAFPFSINLKNNDVINFGDVTIFIENTSLKVHAIDVNKQLEDGSSLNISINMEFKPLKDKLFNNKIEFETFNNFVKSKMPNTTSKLNVSYNFTPVSIKIHCSGTSLKSDKNYNIYSSENLLNSIINDFGFGNVRIITKTSSLSESTIVFDPTDDSNILTLTDWCKNDK